MKYLIIIILTISTTYASWEGLESMSVETQLSEIKLATASEGEPIVADQINKKFESIQYQIDRPGAIVSSYFTNEINIQEGSPLNILGINSKPQITEGYHCFSKTFTPSKIGNYIVVESMVHLKEPNNNGNVGIIALFINNGIDASAAGILTSQNASNMMSGAAIVSYRVEITTLDPIEVQIRAGMNIGISIFNETHQDGGVASSNIGGVIKSHFKITEYNGDF